MPPVFCSTAPGFLSPWLKLLLTVNLAPDVARGAAFPFVTLASRSFDLNLCTS